MFIDQTVLKHLYHPDRHNQIVFVKGAEMIRRAEDRAGAELKRTFIDYIENTGQAFIRRGGFRRALIQINISVSQLIFLLTIVLSRVILANEMFCRGVSPPPGGGRHPCSVKRYR